MKKRKPIRAWAKLNEYGGIFDSCGNAWVYRYRTPQLDAEMPGKWAIISVRFVELVERPAKRKKARSKR